MALSAQAAVTCLRGVGPRVAERLAKLGIHKLQDLLFHLPSRYQDRTRITPIGQCRPGQELVVEGEILGSEIRYGRRRMLLVHIGDETGRLSLRFFNFSKAQHENLQDGRRIRCFGEIKRIQQRLEMPHPEYRFDSDQEQEAAPYLTAIYPTTEGLGQHSLRNLLDQLISADVGLRVNLPDYLQCETLHSLGYPSLTEALAFCHQPRDISALGQLNEGKHVCQLRLAFEELAALHLGMRQLRRRQRHHRAPALAADPEGCQNFLKNLPFALTSAQLRVMEEISADLQQEHPMQRLVQGDVGSGKTVVAAIAALQCIHAGYQVVLMAPTEILAEQHYRHFSTWLGEYTKIALLTGKQGAGLRRELLSQIGSGTVGVAVGTHALFQEQVVFKRVGLIVVDEQHRFGVQQRLSLREKGRHNSEEQGEAIYPHQLIMTATPIPRTLMMTAYADLDCSSIDELPPGRQAVETVVISEQRRGEVLERVRAACEQGRQVYWVCTLVEESEALEAQAAESIAEDLQRAMPGFRVGLIHGRLNPKQKSEVMAAFAQGDIHLLVATTVIEVGVDVANASLMVIENAERLGLSQLHQLRGRVGRGHTQSHCVLLYRHPISTLAKARLSVMRESNDGFEIARRDLELRGPGELLGTQQTGLATLRIADLYRHQFLLADVNRCAAAMEAGSEQAITALAQRWLADKQRYGEV